MPLRTRKDLGVLIVAAYAHSTAICACRSATITATPAAHRCCQEKSTRAPQNVPAPPDRSKHCPHCGGVAVATVAQKHHDQTDEGCATLTTTIAMPFASPCARC